MRSTPTFDIEPLFCHPTLCSEALLLAASLLKALLLAACMLKFSPFCKSSCCQENFRLEKSRQSRREPHEKRICLDHNDLKPLRVSFCGSFAEQRETFRSANSTHSLCRPGLSKNERILRPGILLATGEFGEKREYAVPAASAVPAARHPPALLAARHPPVLLAAPAARPQAFSAVLLIDRQGAIC